MRTPIWMGAGAAGLALVTWTALGVSEARPPARPAASTTAASAAASAEHFGVAASYRAPPRAGHGYSARARHMADCLATYRSYDPDTDRVLLKRGVTRRCEL